MTNTIRLSGHEGGMSPPDENGNRKLKIGIYTGNMWKIAVDEFKHHGRIEASAVHALSFNMTTELAEFMLQRPFKVVEDGLHVDIDIGDTSAEDIRSIMDYKNEIRNIERKISPGCDDESIRLMVSERRALKYRQILMKLTERYGSWSDDEIFTWFPEGPKILNGFNSDIIEEIIDSILLD